MIAMLLHVACVFFIYEVSSVEDYDVLVADVESTLDECFGIVEDAMRHVDEVMSLQDARRRPTDGDDNQGTDVKLGACVSMLEAVNTYREKHNKLAVYEDFLSLEERAYLRTLLQPLFKTMGEVVYVASMDGDDISDFSRVCENQGPILLIVETVKGTVFGGYTGVELTQSGSFLSSTSAFLFRIRPSFGQHVITDSNYAFLYSDDAIVFGRTAVGIRDNALSNEASYVQGGTSYDVIGFVLNDGELNFQAKEYIAMKVIDI